jgi:hypothetical protein
MKDWHNDPATPPNLKPVETGRFFQPVYPNGIQTFEVKTAEWKHLARASFGEARPAGAPTRWTGDSHRYDIYRYQGESFIDEGSWAVRYSHGGGQGWFVWRGHSRDKSSPIEHCLSLPEPQRWDVCNFLCESVERTATEAARDEFNRVAQAYAEGRLKKRLDRRAKARGEIRYKVTVEPKIVTVAR